MTKPGISLQSAPPAELRALPGISDAQVKAIITARPFESLAQLKGVVGEGAKSALRRWVGAGLVLDLPRRSRMVSGGEPSTVPWLGAPAATVPLAAIGIADILRLAMAPPEDCCSRVTSVSVTNIELKKKVRGNELPGEYEAPGNNVFDADDTVRIRFDFVACMPVDIRVDFVDVAAADADRLIDLDDQRVGGAPAGDGAIAQGANVDSYSYERVDFNLSEEFFALGVNAPAEYLITIIVRDACGRIGVASRRFTLTQF